MPRLKSKSHDSDQKFDPAQPTRITEVRYRADTSKRQVTVYQLTELCLALARKPDGSVTVDDLQSVLPDAINFLISANDQLYVAQSVRNNSDSIPNT